MSYESLHALCGRIAAGALLVMAIYAAYSIAQLHQ